MLAHIPPTNTAHPPRPAHPLDLPEIRTRIGHFLIPKSLASCAQVSREWHASFHPLIWTHIYVAEACNSPTIEALQAQARFIRSLELVTSISNSGYFTLKNCVNLTRLKVRSRSCFWSMTSMVGIPAILQEHAKSLRELELDAFELEPTSLIWEAIGRSRLQTLKLHNIQVSPENAQPFLLACSRITTVHLIDATLPNDTASYTSVPMLNGVLDLKLHGIVGADSERQLLFMKSCPNLKSLYWRRTGFTLKFPIRQVTHHLMCGAWSHLQSLDIFGDQMADADLASLIKNISRLEKWRATKTSFGPLALAAMDRHFAAIREVDFHACESMTSPMIQRLLSSMPTLEFFSADRLHVVDILADPLWPCSSHLKTLKVFIDMDASDSYDSDEFQERQLAVLDRLSMLRRLEVLEISRNVPGPVRSTRMRSLNLNVSMGLARLGSLRRLEELWFIPGQQMEEEDVEWIVKTFPKLRQMSFYMHVNYDKNEGLLKTLRRLGKSEVVQPKLLPSSSQR
ncbi:hypothetical protein BGX23_002851 [Mortierella sp. AD031]|nr:hypothetical protein BGX23_002851 [Mortierella sp. AD031]KAG0196092.1 hypothetical protein BGX33_002090 [Mortierella sp. NVP41]